MKALAFYFVFYYFVSQAFTRYGTASLRTVYCNFLTPIVDIDLENIFSITIIIKVQLYVVKGYIC